MSLCECPTHLELRIHEPQCKRMLSCPMDSRLCSCPRFLSTSTNRDYMTRSCKPCFFSVHQITLASAGGITVAAAFSCHAFHCLETASRNSSFSRPLRPCHCFTSDRAAFTRNASFLQEIALACVRPSEVVSRSGDVATDHAQTSRNSSLSRSSSSTCLSPSLGSSSSSIGG